ncbi:TPA: hypothetical protein EYP38_03105 [Candidatus Micrarchaeota archaeon]|nr:hypothetical protein [Candidatus Micrarchaeota archaeon]
MVVVPAERNRMRLLTPDGMLQTRTQRPANFMRDTPAINRESVLALLSRTVGTDRKEVKGAVSELLNLPNPKHSSSVEHFRASLGAVLSKRYPSALVSELKGEGRESDTLDSMAMAALDLTMSSSPVLRDNANRFLGEVAPFLSENGKGEVISSALRSLESENSEAVTNAVDTLIRMYSGMDREFKQYVVLSVLDTVPPEDAERFTNAVTKRTVDMPGSQAIVVADA